MDNLALYRVDIVEFRSDTGGGGGSRGKPLLSEYFHHWPHYKRSLPKFLFKSMKKAGNEEKGRLLEGIEILRNVTNVKQI